MLRNYRPIVESLSAVDPAVDGVTTSGQNMPGIQRREAIAVPECCGGILFLFDAGQRAQAS